MNFRIEDLSNTENIMLINAHKEYGTLFDHAQATVLFTRKFIYKVDPLAWVFISFLSQTSNSLVLALLSSVRRHDVQANMMLRYALESVVLACYALSKPDVNEFGHIDSDGLIQIDEEVLSRAYEWLEINYKTYSDTIKSFKDKINKSSSHANILKPQATFDFDEEMKMLFFDKKHKIITEQRLWWIANISLGFLDLFSKVINDFPLVKLIDDFQIRWRDLGIENERIKQKLMKYPEFAKRIKP